MRENGVRLFVCRQKRMQTKAVVRHMGQAWVWMRSKIVSAIGLGFRLFSYAFKNGFYKTIFKFEFNFKNAIDYFSTSVFGKPT